MKQYSIAIDGPAGCGKSTAAKEVAKRLSILYIDTGAMYRTVGLYCMEKGIDLQQQCAVERALEKMDMNVTLSHGMQKIFLNAEDVTEKIRTQEAGKAASAVAALLPVRQRLVEIQRSLAKGHSVIMDGRDIGTNVLPNATVKIYLNASVEQRTKRRCHELELLGKPWNEAQVRQQILQRDESDMNRAYNPLKKAKDAVEIDTSFMSREEVVLKILDIVKEKINKKETEV